MMTLDDEAGAMLTASQAALDDSLDAEGNVVPLPKRKGAPVTSSLVSRPALRSSDAWRHGGGGVTTTKHSTSLRAGLPLSAARTLRMPSRGHGTRC